VREAPALADLGAFEVGVVDERQGEDPLAGQVAPVDACERLGEDAAHAEEQRRDPACSRELPWP
jgi:hypothetical protein